MPESLFANYEVAGTNSGNGSHRLGEDINDVELVCSAINGVAGYCDSFETWTDDDVINIRIGKVKVTPMALLILHAGLPVGQLFKRGSIQAGVHKVPLEDFMVESIEFGPLYDAPFTLRNVHLTKRS